MKHNLEVTVKVNVFDVPEETYEKLMKTLLSCMKQSIGIEGWELMWLLNPHWEQSGQKPKKSYFPITVEAPDLTEEHPASTTKIVIVA